MWRGVAAHAGVDFEKGANALVELARVVETVSGWTDLKRGLTVSVGVAGGGTKLNVVPAEAWAEVDMRFARKADGPRIERKFAGLKAVDKRCTLAVTGGINRPPMERWRGTVRLYEKARALAAELGFVLEEAATGGASDGNFTAALGVPTLDGLGAVGEGAHAATSPLWWSTWRPERRCWRGCWRDEIDVCPDGESGMDCKSSNGRSSLEIMTNMRRAFLILLFAAVRGRHERSNCGQTFNTFRHRCQARGHCLQNYARSSKCAGSRRRAGVEGSSEDGLFSALPGHQNRYGADAEPGRFTRFTTPGGWGRTGARMTAEVRLLLRSSGAADYG